MKRKPWSDEAPNRDAWLAAAVGLVTALAFWPATRGRFLWDDQDDLVANFAFRGLDWAHLRWMFSAPRLAQYHPLTWLSFAVDYRLFGMDPAAFHRTSVLIHAAAAVACFAVARELLARGDPDAAGARLGWGAALAALLFSLHPLRVESVAWATERRGLLAGFFSLGSVWLYLRGCRRAPREACARRWLAASITAFLLALLSKASAVPLPAALLFLDVYPLARLGGAAGWRSEPARKALKEKLLFLALAAPFALIAPIAQLHGGGMEPLARRGLAAKAGQAAYGLAFYGVETLLPLRLLPLHRIVPLDATLLAEIAAAALAVAAFAGYALASFRRRPWLLIAGACYAVMISPVLGFLQSGPAYVADRYSYLPCAAWAVLGGAAWLRLSRAAPRTAAIAAAAVLLGLTTLSRAQLAVWRDSASLWSRVVALDPASDVGENNLCAALIERGDPRGALAHCDAALRLRPGYPKAMSNRAEALVQAGELDKGIAAYRQALAAAPENAVAHYALGNALLAKRSLPEAIGEFMAALRLEPQYPQAHIGLGAALAAAGRPSDAAREFQAALDLDPADPTAHFDLGNQRYADRRWPDAEREFRAALGARPGYPEARVNLGMTLAEEGRLDEAADEYRAALRLRPDYADAYEDLGIALFQLGRKEEAVSAFQRAVDLAPQDADARFNLRRARTLLAR